MKFKYWLSYLDDLGLTLEEMKIVNRLVEETRELKWKTEKYTD